MALGSAEPATVAQRLVGTALRMRAGESVIIETWNHTLSYAAACVVEARRVGARPMLVLEDETAYWRSIDLLPNIAKWAKVADAEWAAMAAADGYVFFPGPADLARLRSMPQRTVLTGYNSEWYERARKAKLRGVRCALGYASESLASVYGVSAVNWRDQLIQGMVSPDPRAIKAAGAKVARRLTHGRELRITAPNGTDLTLKLRGRTPTIDDGITDPLDVRNGQNMTLAPPGVVSVAVDERSAGGVAIANRPSHLSLARLEGGQWEVSGGRLASALYTGGQTAFDEAFRKAGKGKEVVSYFSLGLNPALAPGVPVVEDEEAGAVTLGVGGNSQYGGTNRSNFFSWIVIGEATVALDGAPLCDRGHLL